MLSGLYISDFYGQLLGIHHLTPWTGVPLTVIVMVFIINAMNLTDGIDGLASGLSIFARCVYGTLFLLHGSWSYAVLAFRTVGVPILFFYYNVFGTVSDPAGRNHPARELLSENAPDRFKLRPRRAQIAREIFHTRRPVSTKLGDY
jgi:hypothetical protein